MSSQDWLQSLTHSRAARAPVTRWCGPGVPWISKSTANVRYDHLFIDYKDFRNALLANEYGAGNEPLYKLNANIFQIFVSIWF